MNVKALIKSALLTLTIPVEALVYEGSATEYVIYNPADERAVEYANDDEEIIGAWAQVHYFTRGDPQAKKDQIRTLLKAAGFTVQSTQEFYEDDSKYFHVVHEVYIDDDE
jgi:hypothetical protein